MPGGTVNPGLYAIVDADALGARPMVPFARRVLAAGSLAGLQLRAKTWGGRAMVDAARALAPWCAEAGVPFYVNDRADVAALVRVSVSVGVVGVHVGMDDLTVEDVRRVAPGVSVGASSHNAAEVSRVLATDADYLAYGPVFGTRSKTAPAPTVGIESLREVVVRAAGRAVVAIGGINLSNADEIRATGARAGAVIAALMVPDEDVTAVAGALHRALGGS